MGKTSLCYFTALALKRAGLKVAVEDLDPAQALKGLLEIPDDSLFDEVGDEVDYLLLDTQPDIGAEAVHEAIKMSDRIMVPCGPAPVEILQVNAPLQVIDKFRPEESRVLVVVNRLKKGTLLSSSVREQIEEKGGTVAQNMIPERQCIQQAQLLGWSGLDTDVQEAFTKLALEIVT